MGFGVWLLVEVDAWCRICIHPNGLAEKAVPYKELGLAAAAPVVASPPVAMMDILVSCVRVLTPTKFENSGYRGVSVCDDIGVVYFVGYNRNGKADR